MDLYCLRVKREVAGKTFPFDRVYMARNGEHTIFKKMFRYALILPVENSLVNLLIDHVTIESASAHPFNRDDEQKAPTATEWQDLVTSEDWVMAVPILSKYVSSNLPRYITAAGKYRHPTGGKKGRRGRRRGGMVEVTEPFPNLTYLQTPTENIRPVCVACPNFINHQNGHCRLGEDICYTNLSLGLTNHFKEGLDVPPPSELEMLELEGD
jgi:hypothetical protein